MRIVPLIAELNYNNFYRDSKLQYPLIAVVIHLAFFNYFNFLRTFNVLLNFIELFFFYILKL